MASAPKKKREEKYLEKTDSFRRGAVLIIDKMLELGSEIQSYILVDEVLHSIFFLGVISYSPRFLPTEILINKEILEKLMDSFPQAFNCFTSKLPSRSPMSCVMDMIVNVTKQKMINKPPSSVEDEILRSLQELTLKLKEKRATEIISSTVCVSQPNKDPNSTRYYGVSMSTSGKVPGRVVVAAACLNNWEEYVAGAVMTYYPNNKKNPDFDGTFKLPDQVRCQAFKLITLEKKAPCKSCANLFGFTNNDDPEWAYGNCAENESISNLLKNEKEVKKHVQPSAPFNEVDRNEAKKSMENNLKEYLKTLKFDWHGKFYTPSENVQKITP